MSTDNRKYDSTVMINKSNRYNIGLINLE